MLETIDQPTVFVTEGGLRVMFQHTDAAPVVAVQFWVRVGSADERPEEAGLAHVHEHMLFKGTTGRGPGEVARAIESVGGSINAWTSFDETVYHVVAPARYFEETFDVLSDAIRSSVFDADELASELVVIDEEIRRGLDQPSRALNQAIFERAFPSHPYGRPVIGTPETVASFTRDDVVAFYERWYRPSNMTLVIVGDVDEAQVRAAVSQRLGDWGAPPLERPARPHDPPSDGLASVVVQREVQHGVLSFAFRGLAAAEEDVAAFDVLTTLAGEGESSILFDRLQRGRGLVDSVWSYSYTPRDPGLVLFGAAFGTERLSREGALEVAEAMAREVAHLRHRAFSQQELRRARTRLESSVIYQRRTVQGIARRLGVFQTLADDPAFERRYYERLARVTPGELARVATRYLDPEHLVAGLLVPTTVEVSEDELEATVRAAFADVEASYRRTIPEPDAWGVIRTTLPSGATVLIRRDTSAPVFSLRASALGGRLAETEATAGEAQMIASLLTSGTSRTSAAELAERVESMAASLNGFAGNNSVGLSMTALSANLPEALELFTEALLHSEFPESEIERIRRETLHAVDASRENPTSRVVELFQTRVFQDHPYGRSAQTVAAGLRSLDRESLLASYRSLLRPERMVIAVVGDVDPNVVLERLQGALEAVPPGTSQRVVRPEPPPRTPSDGERSVRMQREQSHIVIGFPTLSDGEPAALALDVLATILGGQGGRLFVELRDRRSLAYSVGAYHSAMWAGGTFYLYIATSPSREDEAIEGLREQLRRVRDEGVTEDELERAKRRLIGRRDIALQNQGHRSATLIFDAIYGRGDGWSELWPERVEAVTVDSIADAVRAWLDPEFEIVAIVSPNERAAAADEVTDSTADSP